MFQTTLRYGIQKAAEGVMEQEDAGTTIGQQIDQLLQQTQDTQVAGQLRTALKDPQSVIEIRCGKQIQTVSPDMPMRELLSPEAGEVVITVSQPHAGG